MENLSRYTPSTRHLWVFRVTAELGSFTAAASRLNVSQPAVSKCIRQLETALGLALFLREHRRVRLTEAGAKFHQAVAQGFDEIIAVAQELQASIRRRPVTLSVPSAFANYWLIPRLSAFHRQFPDIDLRMQTTDREGILDDPSVSFEVRRGTGAWPGIGATRIAEEVICPIAGRGYFAGLDREPGLQDLRSAALVHLEEPIRVRLTWQRWFDHFGMPFEDKGGGLRLNDYTLVLQAAVAGEGVALGWRHITRELVSRGFLHELSHLAWRTGGGFYLCWSQLRSQSEHERQVRDWLIAEAVAVSQAEADAEPENQ